MANRQSPGGRITKAERKEQARLQRLELQRRAGRTKRNRRTALGVVLVVVAGTTAFALTRPSNAVADPDELLRTGAQATRAAGCGPAENVGPYQPESEDTAHTSQIPPLSTYASVPPASGPHNEIPLGEGVYDEPPPIDRLMHSLEHGAAIVWYAPGATGRQLEDIRAFYEDSDVGNRVIVAPYDYPDQGEAGRLPAGMQMALVAWHVVEQCERVSLGAAFEFTSQYMAPPYGERPYVGEAPEAGAGF
jgi:hypothetical protein